MEDSTPDNTEANFPEYSILGPELTTFVLQVGFVEGIIEDFRDFSNLKEAYQHIFRNNKEYAVLLWNGVPIRLSYSEDVPYMLEDLIVFLEAIQNNSKNTSLQVMTENNQWRLKASLEDNDLTIQSNFSHLTGNYQDALIPVSLLKIKGDQFLSEWKLLLAQLVTALDRSGCRLSKNDKKMVKRLQNLHNSIHSSGILYE